MSNVAIVTGGTRGIGEAISVMLKESGFTVAANFAGNQERADAFTANTGIANYVGMSPILKRVRPASPRSRPIWARSRCWSTTPGSPATARCTR